MIWLSIVLILLIEHYATETTVSRRQICSDIDFYEKDEAGYDTHWDVKVVGLQLPIFPNLNSQFLKTLNPAEIETLQEALELNRMNNIPGFDWVNSI